jgi:alpha-beta hydrolase superfamily lysophospholipase
MYKNTAIDRIILCAPLVRGVLPHLSRIGYILFRPFLKKTIRLNRLSSHDRQFLKQMRNDPFYITRFPLQWAHAHMVWLQRVAKYPANTMSCFIIQGDRDRVVDWRYNLKVLKEKFPACNIYTIEKAKHHLMNESPEYLNLFLSTIHSIIHENKTGN